MKRRSAYGLILGALLGGPRTGQCEGLYPPLELNWQFAAPGGFYAAPAVVEGTLYTGALDHFVYALDAATGKVRWQFETGDQVYSGVAVAGGRAYAASTDKTLYALDAATGKLQWKKELNGVLYATPVVAEGVVFLGTGETGTLYALDAATGGERWTFPMGDRLGSGLAVADGTVYAGSYDHRVYALDAATGRVQWQFVAAGIVDSIPLVADGVVYVKLPDDTVYALGATTGRVRWRYVPEQPAGEPDKLSNWSPLTVAAGRLLFGSNDHHLYALEAATGKLIWALSGSDEQPAAPVVVGEVAYAGGKDGTLTVLDVQTGEMLGQWSPPQRTTQGFLRGIMWPPVVVRDWVYAASLDGHLYAFRGQQDAAAFARWREEQAGPQRLLAEVVDGDATPTPEEAARLAAWHGQVRARIVWESNRDGDWELYRMNADGTAKCQLTRNEVADTDARWSPDGRKILFTREVRPGRREVWWMNTDGSGQERLIANAWQAQWHDEGRTIAFVRGEDGQRPRSNWLYNLQTGQERQTFPNDEALFRDLFGGGLVSPDGQLFVTWRPRPRGTWLVSADGKFQKHVHGGCEGQFSPDGKYVYWVMGPGTFGRANVDGSNAHPFYVVEGPWSHTYFPRVSPDLRYIVFGACPPDQHDHDTSDYEIFIGRLKDWQADGEPVRLTFNRKTDRYPDIYVEPGDAVLSLARSEK